MRTSIVRTHPFAIYAKGTLQTISMHTEFSQLQKRYTNFVARINSVENHKETSRKLKHEIHHRKLREHSELVG